MTINDSFKLLLSRNEPTQAQIDAAEQHLATIKTRLKTLFTLKDILKTGSYSRGTFNKGSSDVDVFAVVTRDDMRWGDSYVTSDTALDGFKQELEGRFWNTSVYRDVQAIVVQFTDCQVDVREVRRQRDAAEALDKLRGHVERVWAASLKAQFNRSELDAAAREIQDSLLDGRAKNPLIFDWINNIVRSQHQVSMTAKADEMLAEATACGACERSS